MQEVLDKLHKETAVKIDRVDDDSMWLYYPMKNADLSFLNKNDKNIIDKSIKTIYCCRFKYNYSYSLLAGITKIVMLCR